VPSDQRWVARAPAIACAVVSAALIVWVCLAASRGHFSGDNGVKFAQSVELWRSGFSSKAMPYDMATDPDVKWPPYAALIDTFRGERQGIYSLVFTGLGAPGIAAFGLDGVVIPALLGTVLALLGVWLLGRRLDLSPWITCAAIAITAGLTPFLFYAGQYQEHSLAAGLVALGLAFLTPDAAGRRRPAIAGALVALAATVRPECYCALPAAGLVVVLQPELAVKRIVRDGLWLVAGAVPVLLAYWGLNHLVSGTWDPLVFHNREKKMFPNTANLLLFGPTKGEPWPSLGWTVRIAIFASLLPVHRLPPIARALVRAALAIALLRMGLWAYQHQHDRVLLGFFAATPLLGYALAGGPWMHRSGALWAFALTFIVEVIHFDKSGVAGGIQLGARFLLPAVPPLIVVAAALVDQDLRSRSRVAAAIALAIGIALVATSVQPARVGYRKSDVIARGAEVATEHARAARGDVVVTRRWWESQVLSPVILDGKRIFNIHGDPTPLLARLRDRGVTDFAYVAYKDQRTPLPGGGEVRTVERWPGWLEVQQATIAPPAPPAPTP
jgi:hypothetical protein